MSDTRLLDRLGLLVEGVRARYGKLVLVIAASSSKSKALLNEFSHTHGVPIVSIGRELSPSLLTIPIKSRTSRVSVLVRELIDKRAAGAEVLLLADTELLFDRTLQLNPLGLLKQLSRARRVIAIWPGVLHEGRLIYAQLGHPEHQDYGLDGLVPFEIQ